MAEEANGLVDGLGEEARNRKSWSAVWAHFERFVGADGRQRARCNKCGAELLADSKKNGTSRLGRHARKTCPGNGSAPEQQQGARGSHRKRPRSQSVLRESPGTSKLPVEEANADLARMVAYHGYHPSFVEDRYFRSLVGRLSPDFQVPSRFAIQDMCDGILKEARRDFESEMDHTSSRVSLTIDMVKIIEGTALYVACHFIDDKWNLRKMIMDEYRVVTDCTYNCEIFGIFEYSLEDEGHCSDLAVNVYDLGGVLDKLFCCMVGEVGNLMDKLYSSEDVDPVVRGVTFVDVVLHSIAQCLFDNLKPDFHSDVNFESAFSTATRQGKEEFLSKLGIDELRPYDQRWFLCYCSLQFLRKNCSETPEFKELLIKLWGEIYHAIKTVSDPSFPTSHLCLVELFKVRDLLQSELTRATGDTVPTYEDNGFDMDVKHVLQLAKDKLYSSIEDSYREWSLPLVLDPRYKLRYIEFKFPSVFGTAAVAENNISKVKEFLRKTFDDYYEDDETTDGDPSHVTSVDQAWYEQCRLQNGRTDVASTELDRYLKDPLVPLIDTFSILNWWKVNSSNYPKVASMARDALAVPTSNRLSSEQISMIRNGIRADI